MTIVGHLCSNIIRQKSFIVPGFGPRMEAERVLFKISTNNVFVNKHKVLVVKINNTLCCDVVIITYSLKIEYIYFFSENN